MANEVRLPRRENGKKIQNRGKFIFFGTVIYLLDKIIETQKITPTHRLTLSYEERKNAYDREKERERECVCMCVCVCSREVHREREEGDT